MTLIKELKTLKSNITVKAKETHVLRKYLVDKLYDMTQIVVLVAYK